MIRGFAAGHAAVAITQHEDFFEFQVLPRASQFAQAQFGDGREFAAQRFGHMTDIAIRRANQIDIDAIVNPFWNGGAQAETLVIGMGVRDEQAAFFH